MDDWETWRRQGWLSEDAVVALIAAGANPNARSYRGETPLHLAVGGKDAGAVAVLLAAGADPNASTEMWAGQETPLYLAAHASHSVEYPADVIEIIFLLLKHGADPNAHSYRTPLQETCLRSDGCTAGVASALLENGADPSGDALTLAAKYQPDSNIVSMLLERGADPNARSFANETPLHWAAMRGNTAIASALLKHGADPNAIVGKGISPLLLAAGAYANIYDDPDGECFPKLLVDAGEGDADMVSLLLAAGADPDAQHLFALAASKVAALGTPLQQKAPAMAPDVQAAFCAHRLSITLPSVEDWRAARTGSAEPSPETTHRPRL